VNLAINARDAMPDGGKLTLEAANMFADDDYGRKNPEILPGQYVVLCVSDTGVGMSPDVLSRAFEPFFTTKELGQGTGLGLSQVYGFVKQSGGHVKLYSEPGLGTTVKIYFPRLTNLQIEDDAPLDLVGEGEKGETILVVEDDQDVRAYLVEVLRGFNYSVLSASNGKAALDILQQTRVRIDLMLTDVIMPGVNGRDLALRARELRPTLKVLHMTGYPRNAILHQGRLENGVELVQKPVNQSELAARIRSMLDQPP
jgi:CheY-like chemotaxis protein